MFADIQTKPFGLGDIFRTAWMLIKSQYRTFLAVCLFIYIPVMVLVQLINVQLIHFPASSAEAAQSIARFNQNLQYLIANLFGIFVIAGLPYFVERTLQGSPPTWSKVLRFGATHWLSYFGTGIVAGIVIGLWSLLLIIPGIIFYVFYSFWGIALVLRDNSGYDALKYSKSLVEGHWWKTFGISLAASLVCFGIVFLIAFILEIISDNFVTTMLINLMTYLAGAVVVVLETVWFLNLDYLKNQGLDHLVEAPPAIAADGYLRD
jgi:hypothetical protein